MIGCLIAGGLAAVAVSKAIRHRRWCAGGGGGWHGHRHGWHGGWPGVGWPGWGGGWGRGGGGGPDRDWETSDHHERPDWDASFRAGPWEAGPGAWGKRFFIRRVLEQLHATPEQERRIADAIKEFRSDLKTAGDGEARKSRHELADALRRPTFDGVTLGEQFARHDTVLEGARKAFVGLVARLHDTLEPEQRTRLADLVDRGPRFGWWGRGV